MNIRTKREAIFLPQSDSGQQTTSVDKCICSSLASQSKLAFNYRLPRNYSLKDKNQGKENSR